MSLLTLADAAGRRAVAAKPPAPSNEEPAHPDPEELIEGAPARQAARPPLQAGARDAGATTAPPNAAQELLKTIGAYIPTDVTTIYVAVAGGIAAVPQPGVSPDVRFKIAIAASVIAAFSMLVLAHQNAQVKARAAKKVAPTAIDSFFAAWYEILAAPVALFAWAAAMPGSWIDWGVYSPFLPPALVAVVSVVLGGLAVLLNRNKDLPPD